MNYAEGVQLKQVFFSHVVFLVPRVLSIYKCVTEQQSRIEAVHEMLMFHKGKQKKPLIFRINVFLDPLRRLHPDV